MWKKLLTMRGLECQETERGINMVAAARPVSTTLNLGNNLKTVCGNNLETSTPGEGQLTASGGASWLAGKLLPSAGC